MSKVILEFDAHTEQDAALVAMHSWRIKMVIDELRERMRTEDKHGTGPGSYTPEQVIEMIQEIALTNKAEEVVWL